MEQNIEKLLEKLELEANRRQSYNDIQRLMGTFALHQVEDNSGRFLSRKELWKMFADRNDVTAEIADSGVFKGINRVKELFETLYGNKQTIGTMFEYDLSSVMLVIADDGKTARGLWHAPGHETAYDRPYKDGDKPKSWWTWSKFSVDFINENGEWKIWHYHWYITMKVPFGEDWTKFDSSSLESYRLIEPDAPTTYHKPYTSDSEIDVYPPCPAPYATWTDALGTV